MNPGFRAARWALGVVFTLGACVYGCWLSAPTEFVVMVGLAVFVGLCFVSVFAGIACVVGSARDRRAGQPLGRIVAANLGVLAWGAAAWGGALFGAGHVVHGSIGA